MKALPPRLTALCLSAIFLLGCQPSLNRLRPDFAEAFSYSLPETARIISARKEFAGYALYAVVELPRKEFSQLESTLSSLPRLEKNVALEVVAWRDLQDYLRRADYVVEANTRKRLARCGILTRDHQVVFAIEYQ